jgi:toxin YoeB
MVKWRLVFTVKAQKDARKIREAGLKSKAEELLKIIRGNPFENSPPFEKLVGDLSGADYRRLTILHRVVYQVLDDIRVVKILRMWSHYE